MNAPLTRKVRAFLLLPGMRVLHSMHDQYPYRSASITRIEIVGDSVIVYCDLSSDGKRFDLDTEFTIQADSIPCESCGNPDAQTLGDETRICKQCIQDDPYRCLDCGEKFPEVHDLDNNKRCADCAAEARGEDGEA